MFARETAALPVEQQAPLSTEEACVYLKLQALRFQLVIPGDPAHFDDGYRVIPVVLYRVEVGDAVDAV